MTRSVKLFLMLAVLLGLVGCAQLSGENSIFRGQDSRYRYGDESLYPMSVPGEYDSSRVNGYYNVPNVPNYRRQSQPTAAPPDKYQKYKRESYSKNKTVQTAPNAKPTPHLAAAKVNASGDLILAESPKAVWAALDKVLKKAGYKVMEKDSRLGAYFVLDVPSTHGRVKRDTPVYQLRLHDAQGKTQLTLLNEKGKPANARVSRRILGAVGTRIGA